MRILQVIPSLALADGGPPWVLAGLAESAVAAGAEVTVCSLEPGGSGGQQSFQPGVEVRLFERDWSASVRAVRWPRSWKRMPGASMSCTFIRCTGG
jgi:hypothetical protein